MKAANAKYGEAWWKERKMDEDDVTGTKTEVELGI